MRKLFLKLLCLRATSVSAWPCFIGAALFLGGTLIAPAQDLAPNTNAAPVAMAPVASPAAAAATPADASYADSSTTAVPPPSNIPPKTKLTWTQCVGIALAHNPDLQVFRDNVLNSDAVRRGAYSLLYPQISVSFSADRSYVGSYLGSPRSYANEFSGQMSLNQTIFNGFLTQGNIAQAKAQLAVAFANLDSQKALTSFDLKTAFAQVLFAQQNVGVTKRIIEIQQNNERLVHLLYDSGNEDKGNWLLTKAQLDQAIYNYNQSVRLVEVSDQQLVTILGQDFPRPLVGIGSLNTAPLPPKPDFHALAIQTPAYFQSRAQADASAAGVTIAQAAFYPTLGFDVSANRGGAFFLPRQTTASGGFTVSYNLFDGGQNYFNVRAARASLLAALESLRSGTDNAQLALAQDYKSLVDAVENRHIQEELLDASALRYKISEAEYRNSLMSFEDFSNITSSYVTQLEQTLQAQQAAVNAEAQWEEARGFGAIP